jgi:hypothetical protein
MEFSRAKSIISCGRSETVILFLTVEVPFPFSFSIFLEVVLNVCCVFITVKVVYFFPYHRVATRSIII